MMETADNESTVLRPQDASYEGIIVKGPALNPSPKRSDLPLCYQSVTYVKSAAGFVPCQEALKAKSLVLMGPPPKNEAVAPPKHTRAP